MRDKKNRRPLGLGKRNDLRWYPPKNKKNEGENQKEFNPEGENLCGDKGNMYDTRNKERSDSVVLGNQGRGRA